MWGQARGGKWHYERKTHISGQGVRFVTWACGARTPEPKMADLPDTNKVCETCIERFVEAEGGGTRGEPEASVVPDPPQELVEHHRPAGLDDLLPLPRSQEPVLPWQA